MTQIKKNFILAQHCQHYIESYLANHHLDDYTKLSQTAVQNHMTSQLNYRYQKRTEPSMSIFYPTSSPLLIRCEQQSDHLVISIQSDLQPTNTPRHVQITWQGTDANKSIH